MTDAQAPLLLRTRDGGMIAGVCAGVARALGWDATIVRGLWVVLSLCFGLGVLAYLALWVALPRE